MRNLVIALILACTVPAHAEMRLSLLNVQSEPVIDPKLREHPVKRQMLINVRAALIALGVWDHVQTIGLARFKTVAKKTRILGRDSLFRGELLEYAIDPELGWEVAVTTDRDMREILRGAGWFRPQTANHHEGRWQLKQLGSGIVLHFIGVKEPWSQYTNIHFDAGGGGLSLRHLNDLLKGKGVEQNEVTDALLEIPAARPHLRGISEEYDRKIDAN